MLHHVTFRWLALALCGWLLAGEAAAMTLGRARGAALIGRPLEFAIPATLEAGDADAPCVEAELFYGDQKISRGSGVRWEPGANRQGFFRVSSPQPVDEPVVTLYLRVGCGQGITRRYVLLAEVPPEPETPAAARPPLVTARPAEVEAVPRAANAPTPAPVPARQRPAGRPAAATAETATAEAPAAPRPRAAAARSGDERRGGARLQLDLLDPAAERIPHLRMASRLERPAVPADPAAREAAAALWQALRRTPDEAVQQGSRLLALERDLVSLRTITEQNAAAVSQMRQQVERARSDRDQVSGLMFVLLGALAALVGWMVWQWRRSPRPEAVPQWFDDLPSRPPVATPEPQAPEPALRTMPEPVHAAVSRPAAPVSLLRPSVAEAVAQAGGNSAWGQVEPADFQPSVGGTVRMVGVQELIDVHDKAHFFLALGQPEQAMEVLDAHVHDQVETSALAWMDLLELYHRFGKHDAFEHLRTEFLERFAVQMPDFEHFDQPSKPLEEYGRALSRIVALWPTRRVLNVIEESIFRKPGLPGADPFSLEAYRDLVLLYHVARDIAPAEDSGGAPLDYKATDFPSTSLQPLNALDTRHPSMEEATVVMGRSDPEGDQPWGREQLMVPPSSPRIGLDIDLDSIPQEAEALQVEEDEDPWGRYEPAAPPVMPSRILDFDVTGLELVDDEPRRKRRW